ncbi:AbiH family protein [Acinetobacter sp. YH01022]|uniref:AbiH family protein n=1 Tax=Acinetobacter sp. YH01022 TaxID=2601036 RepID=UPI0015D1D719|nr:AbiH family protein [Acinetobacter sp. YH01022]
MNILIVGNGFDLSHYLPTKYDHFMDVMGAIEDKDLGKPVKDLFNNSIDDFSTLLKKIFEMQKAIDEKNYQMSFEDLFKKGRDKDFINKTKEIYEVNKIKVSFEQILDFQFRLKNNGWYQYFKHHVKEIKTWIDFEQKIEEVLIVLAQSLVRLEKFEIEQKVDSELDLSDILNKKSLGILNYFNFCYKSGGSARIGGKIRSIPYSLNLNSKYCFGNRIENGFNPTAFLEDLHDQLEEFIKLFNLYLELIVNQLIPICKLSLGDVEWIHPDKIYSFNYTRACPHLALHQINIQAIRIIDL